eukprot:9028209-Ditylum_brightwellii.AAC.1
MKKQASKESLPSLQTNKEAGIHTEPAIFLYMTTQMKKEASNQSLPSLMQAIQHKEQGIHTEPVISVNI